MKNLILYFFCFFALQINSQSFEGKLEYVVNTTTLGDTLINGISKNNLIENLKKQGEIPVDTITYMYTSKGNFLNIYKYKDIGIINTYLQKNNLLYRFVDNSNIVSAIDVSIDLEEILGNKPIITKKEKKEMVGEINCSIVEVAWKTGVYRYHYAEGLLSINPDLFKNYRYDQFYEFLKISHSLPIKIEKQVYSFYKSVYDLKAYNNEYIDQELFVLPKMKENKELSSMQSNKKIFIIK